MRCIVSILWTSAAAVVSLAGALVVVTPRSTVLAAVFPPWWDRAEAFEAAALAGDPVRVGRWPWIVVVRGDAAHLSDRLRSVGAFILLDSNSFAGCGS